MKTPLNDLRSRRAKSLNLKSLETLNQHNQIHNDIKPQNYLAKFLNGDKDLSQVEIVLTDFGLAGSDSRGGTPVFASPECLANPGRKNKSADIFSLGRVFLFMILTKKKFLEFLFVPLLNKRGKQKIMELIGNEPVLNLISKMMRIKKRIDLQTIRNELESVPQLLNEITTNEICDIIKNSTSEYSNQYIGVLKHLS